MSKFKAGDKVVRLGTFTTRRGVTVLSGGEYVVSGVIEGSITLTGYGDYTFDPSNFKLKEETMKIEVGTKFEVVETVVLEGADYIEGEVYEIDWKIDMYDGNNFSTSEVKGDKGWLNLREVLQQAFEEGKFKLLEEGKEMVKVNLDTGLTREIFEEEYAVGTLVKVKDLKAEGNGHEHGLANRVLAVAEEMLEFSNREFTIEDIDESDGTFKLSGAGYWWFSPSMVEIIKSEEGKEMEKQIEFGLVAGDKVKCITYGMDYYDSGVVYTIGEDSWGDFGVLDEDRLVLAGGVVRGDNMEVSFSFDNFEKVTEQPEEEKVEVQEQLTPESKVTIEGKRYKLVRDLPKINEVEVGDFIKILSGKEDVDYSDNGYSLDAGDILKVADIDERCDRAKLKCIKLIGEGSFEDGYIYNRALEDNFEIVEVEVTIKEK